MLEVGNLKLQVVCVSYWRWGG